TVYWGKGAKYYYLPENEKPNPENYADYENKNDGVCTNEKIPDDKPQGSGDIDESKEDNNPPVEGGGGSDKDVKEVTEKMVSAVNEMSMNTGEKAKNTGETAKNTDESKKNTDEIAKNTKEIAYAVKDSSENWKIPHDMVLLSNAVLPEDIQPDIPKHPDKTFEDKQDHFKAGVQ
ncbi:methyl-accepting chemotaxis protein, partial [Bacillus thuringiensis]|nr:methyl-accepting chemotaxis protein [Bacillus thuringiensis]